MGSLTGSKNRDLGIEIRYQCERVNKSEKIV